MPIAGRAGLSGLTPVALIVAAAIPGAVILAGCGRASPPPPIPKVVNLYIWADYLAPDTIPNFEKQTGIKVNVANFDNLETLEARLLTGHSGFDVVVPTAAFLKHQIKSGAYRTLDHAELPNAVHLDPGLMARVSANDPGNAHAVIYTWGTIGIGYNIGRVAERLAGVAPTSWRVLFEPAIAAKLASCGINVIDDPVAVVQIVLGFLGKDPAAPSAADFAAAEALLLSIRPYLRNIDTSGEIEAMANGDLCISLGYNGDFVQARRRAHDARNGVEIGYRVPEEGTLSWFDTLAMPADAAHVDEAYRLIDYLMSPEVIAAVTNAIGFANANLAATPLIDPAIAADPVVYPTADERRRLRLPAEYSPDQLRAVTRIWQRFKTGQ
jgi:putrescine transport system substrate-binding protein